MERAKYLIIGNGITGLTAAKEIRARDKEGSITMVSREPYHTYYKVKLTELIAKDFKDEDILVSKPEWYEENQVRVHLSKIVEKIDYKEKVAYLDDGQEIHYEKLLLATGGRAFIPPINGNYKKGFFALRELRDLHYIKEYLEDKEEVAVLGGGLLGLEAAWALKEMGKKVSVIEHGSFLLARQLDLELSKSLQEQLESAGIKIYLSAGIDEVLGEDRVTGIRLASGEEVKLDGILASTGVRSNLDLAIDTELDINRGILVNSRMETNLEDVYAAGDVAEVDGVVPGLWTAGLEQGRIVGANMAGDSQEYNIPKLFASLKIGPINLFSAGVTDDDYTIYEYKENDCHSKIFVDEGKMIGCILYGDTKAMAKFRKGVFSREDIDEFLEENKLEEFHKA